MVADATARLKLGRAAQCAWGQLSPARRCRALRPLRYAIAEHMDQIIAVLSEETGKLTMDALTGDLLLTLEQMRFYERHAAQILQPKQVGKPWPFFLGSRFDEVRQPHGVVLICAPWNYPFQLAVVPMITALYAGNAVVLKCSEQTPRTAALIAELCAAAELPAGLVQVSCESPADTRSLIDAHPDLIFFTGSSGNGRLVAEQAARQLIPVVMELGGKDAALVFESCDLARTARGVAYGSFANAGQVCVGTKRILVQRSIYQQFLSALLAQVAQLQIGQSAESDLPLVRFEAVRQRLQEQIADALRRGANLLTPAGSLPAILAGVPADASLLAEDSFGPAVCIEPFEAEADAVAAVNASDFALSASIWTRDQAQARRVALALDTGSCAVNDVIRNIGNPYASFGGNKASGFGRYHGEEGLRAFSRTKSVMTITRPRRSEIHWFPFTPRTVKWLRTLLQLRHSRNWLSRVKHLTGFWMLLPLLLCGAGTVSASSGTPDSAPLIVEATLPAHAHGQIAYLVFNSAEGFPSKREKAWRHDFVPVDSLQNATQRIDLGPVPPGRYAVSLYLDENGNHKLDTNWLGLPKEAVGVSNNPRNRIGPPHFEDAVFVHGSTPQTISITLVYCCKP